MVAIGKLYFATKLADMNECDAPESNRIVAGCELARNIPYVCCFLSFLRSHMIDLPVGIVLLPLTASCGLEILSLLALRAFVGEVPLSSTVEA